MAGSGSLRRLFGSAGIPVPIGGNFQGRPPRGRPRAFAGEAVATIDRHCSATSRHDRRARHPCRPPDFDGERSASRSRSSTTAPSRSPFGTSSGASARSTAWVTGGAPTASRLCHRTIVASSSSCGSSPTVRSRSTSPRSIPGRRRVPRSEGSRDGPQRSRARPRSRRVPRAGETPPSRAVRAADRRPLGDCVAPSSCACSRISVAWRPFQTSNAGSACRSRRPTGQGSCRRLTESMPPLIDRLSTRSTTGVATAP